ncbi:hypothetical protein [Lacrimispora saccharolytica]|uniref:Lipoprotein n=1 Tax=Lacrimispora saccharolytica (strain ATCC 35040 / DSM 2544 / NRCC 2533 / WM1) TaxID=610130 RepID=D9R7S7_LACSW|nr:hypothetical protein [Lacrimispora saccharolytica]ADL05581.1 hypothetical protein Closa_3048 [[Clostridium] saccharolyticum WM1]QRV20259.1 hypothetical protein I6K70_01535 [Lacrimispora saccharolytica]
MTKKIYRTFFLIILLLLSLTSCQSQKNEASKDLTGIPVDISKTESVSIYYGSICYSFYDENKETISNVADLLRGFSLKEVPDGTLDSTTTYQIYFSNSKGQTGAVNVDEKGMFYLPDTKKYYQVDEGTFHLEELKKIYQDSMNAGGFDKSQCLIQ